MRTQNIFFNFKVQYLINKVFWMNQDSKNISALGKSIIKTLAYYDIFHYPLTAKEIYHYLQTNGVSLNEILNEIEK